MAWNLNLYDFNGSVRRNKLQEAIFSDMARRDDFMKRLSEERNERHQQSRRKAAAVKIQAVYRGYRTRKQFHTFLRQLFDNAGPARDVVLLQIQISRLAFFFKPVTDCQNTLTLCNDAVVLAQKTKAKDILERRRRQQLLRCTVAILAYIGDTQSYSAALRFIEIFATEEDCPGLLKCGYYSSLLSLFTNHHQLPSPLYIEERLPQRAESLLQMLILPIQRSSNRSEAIFRLFETICMSQFEAVTVCCVVPFLVRLCKAGDLDLVDITYALPSSHSDFSLNDAPTALRFAYCVVVIASAVQLDKPEDLEKVKLATVFARITQKIAPPPEVPEPTNDDSDVDVEPDEAAVPNATSGDEADILTPLFYLKTVIAELRILLSNELFTNALLPSREGILSICALAYFIRLHSPLDHTALMNLFSSFRQLIPNLWQLIISLSAKVIFGATQPLISMLEKGENISQNDEQSLIPTLSLFVTMMTNVLKTVDDDDFQNGGVGDAVVPLKVNQIADVVLHCRDLTLGLIDLAFPVNTGPFQNISQSLVKSSKWSDLFQNVAVLTKALHERDSRLHFMPHNFWSSHNRRVVVNSSLWQGGRGRRRRVRRPFEFVRFLLHDDDDVDNKDPPSASELRNVSIVRSIPFVIPFMQRIEIFTELLLRDRIRNDSGRNGHIVSVRRATLYEDAFAALKPHKVPDMRSTVRVQMVNWAGLEEAGVDGGGIFREFLSELLQTALDPSRGFFAATHEQLLYPNPSAPFLYPTNFVDHFYFIGRIIAKLIYEGLLVDIRFADFFLSQWMGNPDDTVLDLELVKSYDPLLHKNLKFLKRCSPEEVEALDLDFSVIIDNFGATKKVELKKDGSNIKVTAESRMEYIQLYVNYFLAKRLSPMTAAFRNGLRNVLDPEWLRMFSALEISMLIGGVDLEIDFNELKKFTTVHNIKSEQDQQYVDLFWLVINEFSAGDKKKLLKFITGCPRPPIMGFKTLTPPMGIQLVHDVDKLPTAATCMNLLKLPLYKDTETLRCKLTYAINSGAGFELS